MNGLVYVYQLFKEGQYKTCKEVWEEFGLTRLRFNSLKVAIAKELRCFFQTYQYQTFSPLAPHQYDRLLTSKGKNHSQKVYKYLSGDAILIHNKYIKWRQELGFYLGDGIVDFATIHKDIYQVTNIAKYRSFQYRLLQRGLVTNIQLKKWGISQVDSCTFCGEEEETISHLLYSCPMVYELWVKLVEWLEQKFSQTRISLDLKSVLLNRLEQKKTSAINFICLITKQYIYKEKCINGALNFGALKTHISHIENVEKYIAKKNDRLAKHYFKWGVNQQPCMNVRDINNFVHAYVENLP